MTRCEHCGGNVVTVHGDIACIQCGRAMVKEEARLEAVKSSLQFTQGGTIRKSHDPRMSKAHKGVQAS